VKQLREGPGSQVLSWDWNSEGIVNVTTNVMYPSRRRSAQSISGVRGFAAAALWAAVPAASSTVNVCSPTVFADGTNPPNFLRAARCHVSGCQFAVLLGRPLGRELGLQAYEGFVDPSTLDVTGGRIAAPRSICLEVLLVLGGFEAKALQLIENSLRPSPACQG
jgi:hypothetical protein